MRNKVDIEFFLLVVAREITYCESVKRAFDGVYKGQKSLFYEKAKKSKYYNHFLVSEGSLEYEIGIKRFLGVLLCADEDISLRENIIKMIVSYKSEMKFLLKKEFDMKKYLLYFTKKHIQEDCTGHEIPGKDVDFWLQAYIFLYKQAENIPSEIATSFYIMMNNQIENLRYKKYEEEKKLINDANWMKRLLISDCVNQGIQKIGDEEFLYSLGDILAIERTRWNTETRDIFELFMDGKSATEKTNQDILQTSAICLLLDNMLKAEGLNFFNIFTERVISKKDREQMLKAITKSFDGTMACLLNTDEILVKREEDGTIDIGKYNLAYSDMALAFLFRGLIRAIKRNKKYAVSNYPENLYADENSRKASNEEVANYEKQISSLKSENQKLKSEVESLKTTIAQKDKDQTTRIREVEEEYAETIKNKDNTIKIYSQHLIDFAEYTFLLLEAQKTDEPEEAEEILSYNLEELQQKRILVLGGRIEKIQELKRILPKSVFISNETERVPDTKFDLIFFFNNFLSHTVFKKYIEKAREENISVGYCVRTNTEKILSDMYLGLKNSRTSILERSNVKNKTQDKNM